MTEGSLENPHTDCKFEGSGEFPRHWPGCQIMDVDQVAYDRARDLAAAGDAGGLVEMADALPEHIRYNQERNAVQLYSCTRSGVVSTLMVPDELVAAAVLLQ